MKLFLLLLILLGCDGIRPVAVFGPLGIVEKKDGSEFDTEHDRRIDDLEARQDKLEEIVEMQGQAINLLNQQFSDIEDANGIIQSTLNQILNDIVTLQLELSNLDIDLDNSISNLQSQLDILEQASEKNIVELIDPCGDGPGFDEILLKLGDGTYIAYFQSGNKRHLAVLSPGNYRTTDQQRCNFTITSNGDIL